MKRKANMLNKILAGGLLAALLPASGFAVELSEAPIRETVLKHVHEQLKTIVAKEDEKNVSVEILKVPAAPFDFPEALKADEIKITAESSLAETYSDRAIVRIHMEGPAGRSRDIGVPVRITVKKPVWVVKNQIDAQQPLRASDFTLETREVSRTYSHAVGAERKLNAYVARVNMRPGETLDARKILIPPDIKRNEEIKIVMTNGKGMSITLPGISMGEGRIGDTIRVRQLLYQRKFYTARIIDTNRVLIEI